MKRSSILLLFTIALLSLSFTYYTASSNEVSVNILGRKATTNSITINISGRSSRSNTISIHIEGRTIETNLVKVNVTQMPYSIQCYINRTTLNILESAAVTCYVDGGDVGVNITNITLHIDHCFLYTQQTESINVSPHNTTRFTLVTLKPITCSPGRYSIAADAYVNGNKSTIFFDEVDVAGSPVRINISVYTKQRAPGFLESPVRVLCYVDTTLSPETFKQYYRTEIKVAYGDSVETVSNDTTFSPPALGDYLVFCDVYDKTTGALVSRNYTTFRINKLIVSPTNMTDLVEQYIVNRNILNTSMEYSAYLRTKFERNSPIVVRADGIAVESWSWVTIDNRSFITLNLTGMPHNITVALVVMSSFRVSNMSVPEWINDSGFVTFRVGVPIGVNYTVSVIRMVNNKSEDITTRCSSRIVGSKIEFTCPVNVTDIGRYAYKVVINSTDVNRTDEYIVFNRTIKGVRVNKNLCTIKGRRMKCDLTAAELQKINKAKNVGIIKTFYAYIPVPKIFENMKAEVLGADGKPLKIVGKKKIRGELYLIVEDDPSNPYTVVFTPQKGAATPSTIISIWDIISILKKTLAGLERSI